MSFQSLEINSLTIVLKLKQIYNQFISYIIIIPNNIIIIKLNAFEFNTLDNQIVYNIKMTRIIMLKR